MIPKIIHFVWIGQPMPYWARDNIGMFQMINPEFICRTHGKEVLLPFLYPAFESIQGEYELSRKSDVLRIAALLRYGGWYFDTDFLPIRPLLDIYQDKGNFPRESYVVPGDTVALRHAFAPGEVPQREWIANGIIGTTADSAFLACVLRGILMATMDRQRTWDSFGPKVFTDIIEHYPGIAHVGRMDDWFRLGTVEERREAYKRIRNANYDMEAIRQEIGNALPYAFHQSMQESTEL